MFVGRRRVIGTPRPASEKKKLFRKHNEGHSIYTHSNLPPIIQDALSENSNAKPLGILNSYRDGTCGFILNAQLFIWNIKYDVGHNTADVLILDLPDPDCFVSFTGNSSGVFSCTSSGTIQFWPSYTKSNTFNIDLPLPNDVTVTSLECDEVCLFFYDHIFHYLVILISSYRIIVGLAHQMENFFICD